MKSGGKPLGLALLVAASLGVALHASSHREAPAITKSPKLDAADFYMFNSYETGRDGYVTFVADYIPLEDAYGGPNYFTLDPDAVYDIRIDNNGDAKEDLVFPFRVRGASETSHLPIGPEGNQKNVSDSAHPGRLVSDRGTMAWRGST